MARCPFLGPAVEGLREEGGGLRVLMTPCAILGRGGWWGWGAEGGRWRRLWGWKLGMNGSWVGDCVFKSEIFGFSGLKNSMAEGRLS